MVCCLIDAIPLKYNFDHHFPLELMVPFYMVSAAIPLATEVASFLAAVL